VGAAQKAQQLDFLGAGHGLIGIGKGHPGGGELFQQGVHRGVDQGGKLANGGGLLRHVWLSALGTGGGPVRVS